MIDYKAIRPGLTHAVCRCDKCGRVEEFAGERETEGKTYRRLTKKGWKVSCKAMTCQSCVVASRSTSAEIKEIKMTSAPTPREPSREQKRQIMDLLNESYDTEKQRYRNGDTDEAIAAVLSVMPGWVSKLREEFFGPEGGNERIDEFIEKADERVAQMQAVLKRVEEDAGRLRVLIREMQDMKAAVENIKKAVGPRILKLAGQS